MFRQLAAVAVCVCVGAALQPFETLASGRSPTTGETIRPTWCFPAHVSLALSTVWRHYDDFVMRAQQASQTTLDASFAVATEFKALATDLQQACDSCHQAYRRP
jgi:hypothetical protein